jgi:YebC/PmpR family DNA-binding regulatory protein
MSGHSKWATIKRAKAATDAKRGNIFTKLGNAVTVAARSGGGDPDANFQLRLAMDRAKSANMPKDNIERAVKRGTGELGGNAIEELTYGALLPGQVAAIINCTSDNKNRTFTDVKTTITKNGGQFVDLSSISWQFDSKGVIKLLRKDLTLATDELELIIIDSGASDYTEDDEEYTIYTKPDELKAVKDALDKSSLKIESANLEMVAKETKEIDDDTLSKVTRVLDALDELDDVNDYYTNLK